VQRRGIGVERKEVKKGRESRKAEERIKKGGKGE